MKADEEALGGMAGPFQTAAIPLPIALVGSVQAAFLAEHELGGTDLGGAFNIVGEIGVDLRPVPFFSMGYRFHHMSNAGIYDNNPGLNLHLVELAWRF